MFPVTVNLADALIDAHGTWPPKLAPLSQLARSGMNGPSGSIVTSTSDGPLQASTTPSPVLS